MAVTLNANTSTGFIATSDTSGVLQLQTGGTAAVTVDASQNVGIGATPSAWSSAFRVQQIGNYGAYIAGRTDSTNQLWAGTNAYYNGSNFIYTNTAVASQYIQSNGTHSWSTAASGTAGNTISFTTLMTLNANGALALKGASTTATGTGITFPVTHDPSNNVQTLDDYEEGTFTPVDTSGAGLTFGSLTSARYTKIGNKVFVDLEVEYLSTSSNNLVSIGGLPYASLNDGNYSTGPCMNNANLNLCSFLSSSTTSILLYKQPVGAYAQASNANMSGAVIYISLAYTTT